MKRIVSVLFMASGILPGGCKGKKEAAEKEVATTAVRKEEHKPSSSFRDTVAVPANAAVFFQPDSLQLLKIKAATGEPVFRSTVHEYEYQIRHARSFLKTHWPLLKVIDTKMARYLLFQTAEGAELTDLDTQDPSGMFITDGRNKPLLVDMMNVETQVPQYFQSTGQATPAGGNKR